MGEFFLNHVIEIIFGLIAAGALAFCKYLHSQAKNYKKMLNEKKTEETEKLIDTKIDDVRNEIEELRTYIRNVGQVEKSHMDLIISSYKFRLVQLCKEHIRKGYMTQPEYDQITEFYALYENLGGNGQAKEYYERVMRLEIRPVEN